jgi:hypothetical protein
LTSTTGTNSHGGVELGASLIGRGRRKSSYIELLGGARCYLPANYFKNGAVDGEIDIVDVGSR